MTTLDGKIEGVEGFVFIFFFILYLVYLFKFKEFPKKDEKAIEKGAFLVEKLNKANAKELGIAAISLVFIIYAAKFVVSSTLDIATTLGVPANIISVTLIALGTSLPELVVAISALKKGLNELLIGNIIGSNMMNILLIGGVSSMIKPLVVNPISMYLTIPTMILFTGVTMYFMRSRRQLVKWEGTLLLSMYIIFIVAVWLIAF